MSTVVVDAATAETLGRQASPVEVRTGDGQLVGFFTPPVRAGTPEDYEWARQHISPESIEKARQETGGYTTAEVLAHLRSLEARP